jgi:carbonic anhydrase
VPRSTGHQDARTIPNPRREGRDRPPKVPQSPPARVAGPVLPQTARMLFTSISERIRRHLKYEGALIDPMSELSLGWVATDLSATRDGADGSANQDAAPSPIADIFSDVLAANATFEAPAGLNSLTGRAARGLAVVTCMDSRIIPLAMLGLEPGDAKVLRNAGARVTDDVLRTLVLATYLLEVKRVMVIAHTDCRMADCVETDVHNAIRDAGGPDTRSISFLTTDDQARTLADDVQKIKSWPYLGNVAVGGFLCETKLGKLTRIC